MEQIKKSKMMKNSIIISVLVLLSFSASAIQQPNIKLNFSISDTVKTISVVVLDSATGNPVPELSVSIFVNRSFGLLPIGDDIYTDALGKASLPFNYDVTTYDASGKIYITAVTEETDDYAEGTFSLATNWGRYLPSNAINNSENYLWSPKAPLPLVLTFTILLGGIWLIYIYIISLLRKINNAKD